MTPSVSEAVHFKTAPSAGKTAKSRLHGGKNRNFFTASSIPKKRGISGKRTKLALLKQRSNQLRNYGQPIPSTQRLHNHRPFPDTEPLGRIRSKPRHDSTTSAVSLRFVRRMVRLRRCLGTLVAAQRETPVLRCGVDFSTLNQPRRPPHLQK